MEVPGTWPFKMEVQVPPSHVLGKLVARCELCGGGVLRLCVVAVSG